ncbi:hypothetical protein Pd630_LPD07037 [Rhodococcus opacus PD630]|nr:hypothetical protein Pd630_LPD07037 [Rhodococcus opacus PD630]
MSRSPPASPNVEPDSFGRGRYPNRVVHHRVTMVAAATTRSESVTQ